jgi:hypothetical protein
VKRILLALAVCAAAAALAACGDDSGDQDNENGPAANVEGTWLGTYESSQTDRAGDFCVEIAQDKRELTGTLIFAGEDPLDIGGRIANQTLSFVWSPKDNATTDNVVRFTTGGTFSGDADGDDITGTWTSVDGDRGDWSAARSASASCMD